MTDSVKQNDSNDVKVTPASLMMVTYNRLELTRQTLDCIFENTDYPFNLIVVDNASSDKTVDYLYTVCGDRVAANTNLKGFKLQRNESNLGIAVARNQALLMAEGDWLCTLDNDVLLPKCWLTQCIDILAHNPKFGMLGVNMEDTNYGLVRNAEHEWQEKPRGNLGTACTVFNRSLHKLLGFFNTEYGLYGEEDADLGMRVRVMGLRMGYLKENGKHIGEGEADSGEYRAFKTAAHQANLALFQRNCAAYVARRKPLYISFKK